MRRTLAYIYASAVPQQEKMKSLNLLYLSYYNLSYGIGASATYLDQLNDLPSYVTAVVIEPNRVDLPNVKIELNPSVKRISGKLPLTGPLALFYPFIAFFYALKHAKSIKPDLIISMHQPFHTLSLTGHMLSRVFSVPHVVDLQDVLRPMGGKPSLLDHFADLTERIVCLVVRNDLMVFVCNENKQILEMRTKISFKKSIILPNCVSRGLVESVKKTSPRKGKTIRFVFVGRVGKEYGLGKIQSILEASKSFGYDSVLVIAGHDQVGIPNYAKYLGSLPRKETLQLIAESDIGVGPMNPTIAVPLKVVEYLALGKIVIVGKNAVSKDIINKYESIVEVSDGDDPREVMRKLISMLENPKFQKEKTELYCSQKLPIIIKAIATSE